MTKGERLLKIKASTQFSVLLLLSFQCFWSGKPGGSGFPNPEVPGLGVGCHMPCNKFVFSSCGLENKLYCVILCGEPCLDAIINI